MGWLIDYWLLRVSSLMLRLPWLIFALLFRLFGYIAPKPLNVWFSNLLILSILAGGYSGDVLCTLNLLSTFLLCPTSRISAFIRTRTSSTIHKILMYIEMREGIGQILTATGKIEQTIQSIVAATMWSPLLSSHLY